MSPSKDHHASSATSPVWIVVPAAGRGARMGADLPKQYLPLAGKTLLENTLARLAAVPSVAGIAVALSPDDEHWRKLALPPSVHRVAGGAERGHSVLHALDFLLRQGVEPGHWVLVHDAARPCVRPESVARLRREVEQAVVDGACGGILAKPVADTLKQVQGADIRGTVDRTHLWQAHTPQMFRLSALQSALELGLKRGLAITDEASAMERQGGRVLVVEDTRDNIKVTHPEDLLLAELILQKQAQMS